MIYDTLTQIKYDINYINLKPIFLLQSFQALLDTFVQMFSSIILFNGKRNSLEL